MPHQHPHDDPERTTPIGLARYAAEFLEAALAADDRMGARLGHEAIAPVPVMYLAGHSIELALKAFLTLKGVALQDLRKHYGHSLREALKAAHGLGLAKIVEFSAEEVSALEVLDRLYSEKELEYIITGAKQFPVFGPVESASLKLVHGIGKAVGLRTSDLPHAL
jgi:hypothetical protein